MKKREEGRIRIRKWGKGEKEGRIMMRKIEDGKGRREDTDE